MTPKQVLDSFSETLMQDERILSAQERALLRNLIHHARSASLESEVHEAVNATIASAVGETVAQRAFAVLGASIVERILESSTTNSPGFPGATHPVELSTPGQPIPPSPPAPGPPGRPRPDDVPLPPSPAPGPPGISAIRHPMPGTIAVLERSDVITGQCVVLNEFLAPQELQELTRFALEHEAEFRTSEVIGQDSQEAVDQAHRRSQVLMDLGKYQDLILCRIQSAMPLVLSRLNMEEFPITNTETQITASNNGDFFKSHTDDGSHATASRQLTFVYFFHREPRRFHGGELRLYDSTGGYRSIVPEQNQIVFFPCSAMHEITPVDCPSGLFADSRFTVNGWLR